MASFWSKVMRALDQLLGEPALGQDEMDPDLVEEAIRRIQAHVDEDRRGRNVKRLRISELSPEHRAQLAEELAGLLKQREGKA